jgi:WhiB family redox-sensing transcriptional regulator
MERTDAGVNIVLAESPRVRTGMREQARFDARRVDLRSDESWHTAAPRPAVTDVADVADDHSGARAGEPGGRGPHAEPGGHGDRGIRDDDVGATVADDGAAAPAHLADDTHPADGPMQTDGGAGKPSGLADVIDLGFGDAFGDPPEWQERALCAQTDPEAFFPEKGGSTREAKRICSSCEVRAECLEYALEKDERFGIWGGMSERERRRLRRRAV